VTTKFVHVRMRTKENVRIGDKRNGR